MRYLRLFLLSVIFINFALIINSQTSYKAVVGQLPGIDPSVKLLIEMGNVMNIKIDVKMVPMARMVEMMINKEADIGYPMIVLKDQNKIKQLPYDYSTINMSKIVFVLYTNKAKSVDLADLLKGNTKKSLIFADISNASLFNFKTQAATNPEGAFKRVSDGLADGYIQGQLSGDPMLRALKLTNIKRQFFDEFNSAYILQKGAKNGPVDKFLTDGTKELKQNGKYNEIIKMDPKLLYYDDWQL